MNYYAHYTNAGKILYKEETENDVSGIGVKKLTQEEYNALDIDKEREIFDLKKLLLDTDYIACKIAEGAATIEEYSVEIEQRREWRNRINELQGLV